MDCPLNFAPSAGRAMERRSAREVSSGQIVEGASPLVWSIAEIVRENLGFPSAPWGAKNVLFFANADDGILFGHRLVGGDARRPRRRVAPDRKGASNPLRHPSAATSKEGSEEVYWFELT